MEYVLAGLALLLVVALGAGVGILTARRRGRDPGRAAAGADYGAGVPGTDAAILAPDQESPLGDTSEHAGDQRNGETVAGQDAEHSGGSGRPRGSGYAGTRGIGDRRDPTADERSRSARPVDGGEGEGTRRLPDDE